MSKSEAIRIFKESYGDSLHQALRQDYLAVQFDWECFIDCLCKNGDITMQQYDSWTFPWGY